MDASGSSMPTVVSTEYPDQVLNAGKVTMGEVARRKMQKTTRQKQSNRIAMAAVALLNSGGGIIRAEIENQDYKYDMDGIGQDLEDTLKDLVNPSTIEDHFEFLQGSGVLQIFVKSWSSSGNRARLCCVDTGLRQRSGSSTTSIESHAVLDFLEKKKTCLAQCQEDTPPRRRRRWLSGNGAIKQLAQQFFERNEVKLGEVLPFGESVNVEIKAYNSEKIIQRLEENIPKYLSAFANSDGGYIFVGVDDKTKRIVGCGKNLESSFIKTETEAICRKVIPVHMSHCAQKNNWSAEVRILKVLEEGASSQLLHVVAIHVPVFCCVTFEKRPESWQIENDEVCLIQAGIWLEKMQPCDPDEELCSRSHNMLSQRAAPPRCKPVYGIKKTHLEELQQSLVPVTSGGEMTEPAPLKELFHKYPNLQNLVQSGQGARIFSKSWAVDIGKPRNQEVLCEILLVLEHRSPTLCCVVKNATHALWEYCKDVAFHLKQQLVNLGGYEEWLCVIPQLAKRESGVLWIFLDYFQQSHNSCSGLPPFLEQTKIMLYESLRNSVKIHDKINEVQVEIARETNFLGGDIKKHLGNMAGKSCCTHTFQGAYKEIRVKPVDLSCRLISVIQSILNQGHLLQDIAVLGSTIEESEKLNTEINRHYRSGNAEAICENVIVVTPFAGFLV